MPIFWIIYPPSEPNLGSAIFFTTIRLAALGALAAVTGFALKVFRANLHMYYHTLHRQQLTESIQSFVDAARTDEQRDIIFGKLVEAVATFGNSGLMSVGDDNPNILKIGIEALPKLLARGEH